MPRAKHQKTEYEKALRLYRQCSPRHVLTIEADMPEDMKRRTFALSDRLRICGNGLTARLSGTLEQLARDKKYRGLSKDYGKLSEQLKNHPDDKAAKAERRETAARMTGLQKQYHVTWEDARRYMVYLKSRDGIDSIFALTRAEDIWSGVEKVLYSGADKIHFKRRGDLPEIRAKQPNRGIVITVKDGRLWFSCSAIGKESFTNLPPDKFQSDELAAVLRYLEAPKVNDKAAVGAMLENGKITDTYRPCFASLVCKEIRGRLRVYIHLTIEGRPLPKYKSDGITPRHKYGKGRVGIDIGTQTIAYTSDTEVGLRNLSERGMPIQKSERKERLLLRRIERSRRAMNPQNYNPDGTVMRGSKTWDKSKRGIALEKQCRELCRKNAASRHYAIHEDINHLRSLGDTVITEPPNFKALQKRAKPEVSAPDTPVKKPKRRKRFGRSLQNRSPGAFQAALKQTFESTGGSYHEVDKNFRASQYDHTGDVYVRKKLSQRMFDLADGSHVQRDWYSSFLMYNTDDECFSPDQDRCSSNFDTFYDMQNTMIAAIKKSGIHVLNSGIR